MSLTQLWKDATFIGFDLETTGQYPIQSEICEIGAVKWRNGKIIDRYSTLIKPTQKMSDEVIAIHNITNEMVVDAPSIQEKLPEFYDFIQDGFLVAHHAPFDVGFLTIEMEKMGMILPRKLVFCSSLISRQVITGVPNHKLQTLIPILDIEGGSAHRATDDANACLDLFLICLERVGKDKTLQDILDVQRLPIYWVNFSLSGIEADITIMDLVRACYENRPVSIIYDGGTNKGKPRKVYPVGLVRGPSGDFFVGKDSPDDIPKRFYLKRIREAAII